MKTYMQGQYKLKGDYGINGYTDEAARAKEQFLRDGTSFAKAVNRILVSQHGWTAYARKNKGGVAVSGEVYNYMTPPDGDYEYLLEIGTTSMRGGHMSERQSDGALFIIQRRTRETTLRHRSIVGGNRYYSVATLPEEIARIVLEWSKEP